MNQQMRDTIAQYILEGREQDLYNCGCMGCPKMRALPDYTGPAMSLEHARAAVRKLVAEHCECGKNCGCQCTLPAEVERRAAFRAEVEAIRREMLG